MEAKELRIGNWVRTYGLKNPEVIESCMDLRDAEALEPVPLTEEWLLKFGFKADVGEYRKDRYLLDSEDRFMLMDNSGYAIIIARNVIYAHQLQNLYFALTGEEL